MAQRKAFAVKFDDLVAMASEHCQAFNCMDTDALFIHNLEEMVYAWWCSFQYRGHVDPCSQRPGAPCLPRAPVVVRSKRLLK
jgi:hypothetical protein